ncbi:hypothetical protein ABEB36_007947 [Hypothenemus hampei]|uniref:Uncharacterized protein n=1 Tax=Hypothenemus hampei TaxID=57062 RepID=A0ABD1EVR5_HYPHA
MRFILERTIPRESVDSVSQSSVLGVETGSGTIDEELFSPTLSDAYHTDCELLGDDSQGSEIPSVKQPVTIQSIHRLTTPTDSEKSSSVGSTSFTCPSKKRNSKKRKFEDDPIMETAVNSLKNIQKAITVNMNTVQNSANTNTQNLYQSETFPNFIGQQLLHIEQQNEELFLNVHHETC